MLSLLAMIFGGLGIGAFAFGGSSDGNDTTSPATPSEPSAPSPPTDTLPDPEPIDPGSDEPDVPGPIIEELDTPDLIIEEAPQPTPADDTPDVPSQPDSAYDIGWAGLSAEEQLIVELVNRARLDPNAEVDRLNDDLSVNSSSQSVQALAVVPTLSNAAETHSEDMDNRDYFSHYEPDGGTPWDRAIEAGHENGFVGENIGWIGSSSTSFDEQTRAESHHANLWNSDGHQENLLGGSWTEIGLGYDYGDYRGYSGSTFVTELFGDTGETYLTGVVIRDGDGDDFYDMGEGLGDVRITATDQNNNVFTTSTWDAGGYALELPAGNYRVVFEGGDLSQPYEANVSISNENVKLDVIDEGAAQTLTAMAPQPTESDVMALLFPEDAAALEQQCAACDVEEENLDELAFI